MSISTCQGQFFGPIAPLGQLGGVVSNVANTANTAANNIGTRLLNAGDLSKFDPSKPFDSYWGDYLVSSQFFKFRS